MASENRPEIFVLSLVFRDYLDQTYTSLFDKLTESARVKRVKTAPGAIRYLAESNPKAIIITDEGLTKQANAEVLQKIVSYVNDGGLAIFGLHFPNFTGMDVFDNFFVSAFELPWKHGDYHRTDFELNPSCTLPNGVMPSSLPQPFSMKSLHVKGARPHEKIFVPVSNAMTQSRVFPPAGVDQAQAAVTGAKIGDGYLVYCGDVNGEDGTNQIILALCGL